jgi:hydroxypyruvate reductase
VELCFCLISGGGSALMPAPVESISLDDKILVARILSAAGANIAQLNTVRSQLSRVKGGGLARACRAGRLLALIISDVPGDPLEIIASCPTVTSNATPDDALAVLGDLGLLDHLKLQAVVDILRNRPTAVRPEASAVCRVTNLVIGNNALAVDAAGCEAERLGYSHAMIAAKAPEGAAEDVGRHLAEMALRMRREPGPDCLISGGEPTVKLIGEANRGKGGTQSTAGPCCTGGTRRVSGNRAVGGRHGWRRWADRCGRGHRRRRGCRASATTWDRCRRLSAEE